MPSCFPGPSRATERGAGTRKLRHISAAGLPQVPSEDANLIPLILSIEQVRKTHRRGRWFHARAKVCGGANMMIRTRRFAPAKIRRGSGPRCERTLFRSLRCRRGGKATKEGRDLRPGHERGEDGWGK